MQDHPYAYGRPSPVLGGFHIWKELSWRALPAQGSNWANHQEVSEGTYSSKPCTQTSYWILLEAEPLGIRGVKRVELQKYSLCLKLFYLTIFISDDWFYNLIV